MGKLKFSVAEKDAAQKKFYLLKVDQNPQLIINQLNTPQADYHKKYRLTRVSYLLVF
jgi:hypothetical protein